MNNATSTIVPAKNFCSCGPEILLLSIIPTQCLLALHHTELDLILEIFEGSWLGVFVWHCAVLSIQLGTAGFFRTGPESLESGLGTGVCDIVAYALRRGRLVFFADSPQKNPHDCIGHLIVAYLAAGVDHRRAHHIA